MSSLYVRANPPQARMLRIIEGAVKNACDAHCGQVTLPPRFARSIAKRAVGTLSAQWREVLAAKSPSKKASKAHRSQAVMPISAEHKASDGAAAEVTKRRKRVSSQLARRDPLRILEQKLFRQMRAIKLSGQTAKADAWIEVLRMISELKQKI